MQCLLRIEYWGGVGEFIQRTEELFLNNGINCNEMKIYISRTGSKI